MNINDRRYKEMIKLIMRAVILLVGSGMTIYGVGTSDAMWVAFGFPIFLMATR